MTRASAIVFDLQAGQNRAKLDGTSDQRLTAKSKTSIIDGSVRRIS